MYYMISVLLIEHRTKPRKLHRDGALENSLDVEPIVSHALKNTMGQEQASRDA